MKPVRVLQRLLVLCLILTGGCQTVPESKGTTRAVFEKGKLTPFQIRVLLNDFTARFALRVEGAADRILAGSPSPAVARRALLWKINGISACFMASSRSDPLAALGDVTILTIQMRRFFEDAVASSFFGPGQPAAVDVSRELEHEILEIRALLSDDKAGLERGLQGLREIADRAPLTDLTFVRGSIVREYLSRVLSHDRGVFEVVGTLDERMAGLQDLLVLQLGHLPKRMRWEAEVLLLDIDRSPSLAAALNSVGALKPSVDRLMPVVEALPKTLTEERRIVLDDVAKIRDEIMTEVDDLRTTTVDDIRQERRIVLAEIDTQVSKFTRALDGLTHRRVDEALAGAHALFWKAMGAGVLAVVALASVTFAAIYFLRRPAPK